ncbi:MAG: exo-beta-N-acetylmuramidase NamZ domain-containing protein [Crocinitomicaceae bacterium]
MRYFFSSLILLLLSFSAGSQISSSVFCNDDVSVGSERLDEYLPMILDKKVGLVGNLSSRVGQSHLVDTLLSLEVELVKIFSPEHGFRGEADAGEKVNSNTDIKSGLPIVSLYGRHKKPTAEDLDGLDFLIFDIQDVGARFYTYISTLHFVMEACARNNVKLIVLDRPNPNGFYVDGPVLNPKYKSFVGMHPVPIVHGMTIGEYARMINGEHWLPNSIQCNLTVIKCSGWDHSKFYRLPIKPSPNLPNMLSVYLYPSLCFFEGTVVSVGRGTNWPFQIIGHPSFNSEFSFTPIPNFGSKNPKLNGVKCKGVNFVEQGLSVLQNQKQIQLSWFIEFYKVLDLKEKFFLSNNFINLLAGDSSFKRQIINGESEALIRARWQPKLDQFKTIRKQYLLYADFKE